MKSTLTVINILLITFLAKSLLLGCDMPPSQPIDSSLSLRYTVANGYFVKNNYSVDTLQCVIITDRKQLDDLLGMAATMGTNGRPTDIEFNRQYAIACIHPATDYATTVQTSFLSTNGDELRLKLKITKGARQSFTMVPLHLLVVEGSPPANFRWEVSPN
jgi:hypothetical protein